MAEVLSNGAQYIGQRVIQTFAVRANAITTTSYVPTGHIKVADGEWVSFEFAMTWVDSTSHQWYLEWSPDGSTFYRELNTATSGGTDTMTAENRTYTIGASGNWIDGPIRVRDVYVRVVVKKTAGVGADSLAITATLMSQV